MPATTSRLAISLVVTFAIAAALSAAAMMARGAATGAEPAAIPEAARKTIADANKAWIGSMKREDAAAIAGDYADDGVFVAASGESVQGRAAIEQFMRNRFEKSGRMLDGTIVEDGMTLAGARIYEWGHATTRMSPKSGEPVISKGRYLTVWAADAAGHWRILRNLSLPD